MFSSLICEYKGGPWVDTGSDCHPPPSPWLCPWVGLQDPTLTMFEARIYIYIYIYICMYVCMYILESNPSPLKPKIFT